MGGCLGKAVSHSTCTDKLLSHVSSFNVFLSLPSRAAYIIWRSLLILSISRSICIRPPKALQLSSPLLIHIYRCHVCICLCLLTSDASFAIADTSNTPRAPHFIDPVGGVHGWLQTVSCTSRANLSLVRQESCSGLQEQSNKQSGDWCRYISG